MRETFDLMCAVRAEKLLVRHRAGKVRAEKVIYVDLSRITEKEEIMWEGHFTQWLIGDLLEAMKEISLV